MSFDSPPPPEKPQRGCVYYGVLFAVITIVLGIAVIGGVTYFGYRHLVNTVTDYTENVAETMPPILMPEPEQKTLLETYEAYTKSLEEGTATEPLILTSDEMNVLINQSEALKGHVHVVLEGDEANARISMPIKEMFPLPGMADRFLNASAKLRISFQNGHLDAKIDDIEVKGKPLPDEIRKTVEGNDLVEGTFDSGAVDNVMKNVENIVIKNSTVIITPRPVKKGESVNEVDEQDKDTNPPEAPQTPVAGEPKAPETPPAGAPPQPPGNF